MIKSSRTRVSQACEHCRSLKLKCTSGSPCNRCLESNVECLYIVNRPKPKPVITKPKFHRLQSKQITLEKTWERVQELLKAFNSQNNENLSSDSFFEMYFDGNPKAYQMLRTPSCSPRFQDFPQIIPLNRVNLKETALVVPNMKQAQYEFFKKLIDIYLNYNFHNFPMLLKKDLYKLLEDSPEDSIILNAVFATALKLFYGTKNPDPYFSNPFYSKLKSMITHCDNVMNLDYVKACILSASLDMSIGLYFPSATSNGIATRLSLSLGLDKICYSCEGYLDSKNFDGLLVWMNTLAFDRLQCSNLGTPTIVPLDTVEISLDLLDFVYPEDGFDDEDNDDVVNMVYYIQAKVIYCMSTTMFQMSKLHRLLKDSQNKNDFNQITSDFNMLNERIERYSKSKLFYPIDYQLSDEDLKEKELLYSKFVTTSMYRVCFIKFGQLLQDYYYYYYIPSLSNPQELTTPQGPLSKLYFFQNQSQLMIVNYVQMVNHFKSTSTSWQEVNDIIYISSPSIAYTTASLCQFLVTDLSLLGKTLFKFCYEELKKMSELWPMVSRWVVQLEKHYESIKA